ncbi:DUF551 domain-containing protein [Klebsiella pneumoniae]|uniref:DUF551 domain-containing protein n=1 Tax=Klebsiella pneumoniae TaxID=573 RepID=UPI001D0A42E8|nr:DUF551 domain-containing protein [Klebsiella pneumoniae]
MTKSTITRERLEQLANFKGAPVTRQEEQELARMALSAMDSEPVIVVGDDGGDALSYRRLIQSFEPGTKLYRHAQPSPEMKPVGYLFVSEQGVIAYSPTNWGMPGFRLIGQIYGDIDVELQPAPVVPELMVDWQENEFSAGWNACRAAMLAAAPHDTPALNSVQSVVTVPGKWIPLSEQIPPSRHEVLVGRWWGEKPRWCCKWATYIPGHPDAQSSGWLIPGASWTPTHWMPLPAAPQEVKSES